MKIIRVFIGSPGGLDDERQAAHDVVNSVNQSHSERWHLHFKLFGWESAVPGYGRPQSKINEDLDKCDYFIGVLWDRWGSPPTAEAGIYTSGFEEELIRATDRLANNLMKDVAVYFKIIHVPSGLIPGDDMKRVLDLKQRLIEGKELFFKEFVDTTAFRDRIREKLEEIGWKETEIVQTDASVLDQSDSAPPENATSSISRPATDMLFDDKEREFLSSILSKPSAWGQTSPQEVARLRLIAAQLHRGGNDEAYLGTHDANLIFRHSRNNDFSKGELNALIDCGVVGFNFQNTPLWKWLAKASSGKPTWHRIHFLAIYGTDNEKRFAIEILELLGQQIPSDFDEAKISTLKNWFSDGSTDQVVDAAIAFIAANATAEDIEIIHDAVGVVKSSIKKKLNEALATILARIGPRDALEWIVSAEIDRVSATALDAIFAKPASLTTQIVERSLSSKSETVRLRAMKILIDRDELVLEAAKILLIDSSYEVRLLAAIFMSQNSGDFSENTAQAALRISRHEGLFVGLGTPDDTYLARYKDAKLAELTLIELKSLIRKSGALDYQKHSVLFQEYPSQVQNEMRAGLADCFSQYFENKIHAEKLSGILNDEHEVRFRDLSAFIRTKLTGGALNGLCKLNLRRDITLFRSAVDNIEVEETPEIIKYFSKFGRFDDVDRILKLTPNFSRGGGLLSIRHRLTEERAAAILNLSKKRIADLLQKSLDKSLKIEIIKQMSTVLFKSLSTDHIQQEFRSPDDEYRIVFSLKCLICFDRSRIVRMLDQYVDGDDHRFYNVIHWLDLGSSYSFSVSRKIAQRALAKH